MERLIYVEHHFDEDGDISCDRTPDECTRYLYNRDATTITRAAKVNEDGFHHAKHSKNSRVACDQSSNGDVFHFADKNKLIYKEQHYITNDEDNIVESYGLQHDKHSTNSRVAYDQSSSGDVFYFANRNKLIYEEQHYITNDEDDIVESYGLQHDKHSKNSYVECDQSSSGDVFYFANRNKLIYEEQYYITNYEDNIVQSYDPNSRNNVHILKTVGKSRNDLVENTSDLDREVNILQSLLNDAFRCSENMEGNRTQHSNCNVDTQVVPEIQFAEQEICLDLEKIALLAENLRKILRNFKKCQGSSEKFCKVYPLWNSCRRRSMTEFNEIADALDKTKYDCNVAKLLGSSVGAAGGILGIVGAVLIPFTLATSTPLMVGGIVTSVVGGSTSLGTAITEVVILKQKVEKAQEVLRKDEEQFQHMYQWFRHTATYIDSVNELLDFDVFAKIVTDMKTLFSLINDLGTAQSSGSLAHTAWKAIAKKLPSPLRESATSLTIIIAIATNPKLTELFEEVIQLHSENPVVFETAAMTARIWIQIMRGLDLGGDFLTTLTTVTKMSTMTLSASVGRAVSQGLFSGLGLAIDVVSLVLTSIDVRNGSKCPSAEKIREVNKQLNKEFDVLKYIYSELRKCGMT